jgi:hypothetical protein
MLIKFIVLTALLGVLVSLGSGLFYLIRDEGKTNRAVGALTWRIVISLVLFIFLFLAFKLHWIAPHGIIP